MVSVRKYIGKIPRKFLIEVFAVVGGLFLLAFGVSLLSPYTPQKEYEFTDPNTSTVSVFRATIKTTSPTSVTATLDDGPNKGESVTLPLGSSANGKELKAGSIVLLTDSSSTNSLNFHDLYRLPVLIVVIGIFIAVVLLVGRRKGLMSLAGLGASIIVIGWIIIPLLLAGYNSLFVTVLGAYIIAIVSVLLAHGLQKRTYISLLCILIVLLLVTLGSQVVVALLGLTGVIDETANYLEFSKPDIDLGGILVGGIVIAALGALDDVVTTQVATVDELRKLDKSLSVMSLYRKASSVGGEHIASLVNTLALVYVGAALPVIVTYAISTPNAFLLFNSEFVATEVTRTVIVSIGLVVSVPISTFMAAFIFSKMNQKIRTHS